jgi:hypothetical protein
LAATITYIFANVEALDVSTRDYSLWGGSAGVRKGTAFEKYTINPNTLLRYASRKHKKRKQKKIIATTNQ